MGLSMIDGSEAVRLHARLHAVACRAMLGRIAHDASLADLAFAGFKLRLDQDDHLTTFRQQRHDGRESAAWPR